MQRRTFVGGMTALAGLAAIPWQRAAADHININAPELEEMVLQWRRQAEPAKRQELSHAMQRFIAQDMLWCNISGSPYFQAARDYVKGYHFMHQLYVFWDTTWLDKKA